MGREPWTSHLMGMNYTDDMPHMSGSAKLVEIAKSRGLPVDRPFGQLELFL